MELVTYLDDYSESINELTKLKIEEEKRLGNEGYFKEDKKGYFYGIFETRPYMCLLYQLGRTYQEVTSYCKAANIYKRMIELNENDNLGTLKPDDLDEETIPGYYKPYYLQEVMIYFNEFEELFSNEILADFMIKTFK